MITVVVLGLGQVGSRNAEKPGLETLSHVGAILADGGYEIIGLVDPSAESREAAARVWAGRPVGQMAASVRELGAVEASLVVVAGSTGGRSQQIDAALSLKPKVLLIEKPLAVDAVEGRDAVRRMASSGAVFRVNFNRRFDPGHVLVKQLLVGAPQKATLRYGKGLRNYASHMVDLLLDWFGAVESVQAFGPPPTGDGPLDFCCRMTAGFDALIVGMTGLDYDQFEIDLFYKHERIELADGGYVKRRYRPIDGRVYPGYRHLTDTPETLHSGPVGGFVETYAAIRRHLVDGIPLAGCGPADAISGLAVIDAALRSAALGGISVSPTAQL